MVPCGSCYGVGKDVAKLKVLLILLRSTGPLLMFGQICAEGCKWRMRRTDPLSPLLFHDINIRESCDVMSFASPIHCWQEQALRRATYSRGKTHGALVSAGMAASQVRKAASLVQTFTMSQAQDVARTVFSELSRGRSSATSRKVRLGCQELLLPLPSPLRIFRRVLLKSEKE